MKRTKYGKGPQKTIYVPNDRKHEWEKIVDQAEKTGEGVGIIILNKFAENNKI